MKTKKTIMVKKSGKSHFLIAVVMIFSMIALCACVRADSTSLPANTSVSGEGQENGSQDGQNRQEGNGDPNGGADVISDNNGQSGTGSSQDGGNASGNEGTSDNQNGGNGNTEAGNNGTGDNVSGTDENGGNASDNGGNMNGGSASNNGGNGNNGNISDNGENGNNGNTSDNGGNGNGGNASDNGGNGNNGNTSDNGGNGNGGNISVSGEGTNTPNNKKHIVVLDPGHGGKRGGAWYLGIAEKDITLKVAKYARDHLLENYENIEVVLTREEDVALDPDNKVELEMRCDIARQVGADCLVSIHFNATDAHKQHGAEVWISRNEAIHDQTLALGESIIAELEAIGIRRNSVASRKSTDMFDENGRAIDYYAINRHCAARGIPGIIVEQCYMDNEIDQVHVTTEEGLKELGEANARGIANYLELPLKKQQ